MLSILLARWRQKHRTLPFPRRAPELPDRFCGAPTLAAGRCVADCHACEAVCPTEAVRRTDAGLTLDVGRCLFCRACAEACPHNAIAFGRDYRLATRARADLVLRADPAAEAAPLPLARALDARARRLFGRSLKLRQVSAGGCNACEADLNVLNTVVFDLGRFGIQFVASPRHADALVVTGPVTHNMDLALRKTWEALPAPRLAIAVGACAIAGGPYIGHPEAHDGAEGMLPIALYVPGCPPHPLTMLDGLLRLLGRLEEGTSSGA